MKKYYDVHRLMDNVYVLFNSNVNIALVVGKDRALVWDTGMGYADPMPQIREITDKPIEVVISHGHFDHLGGLYFFDAPVYMSQADLPTAKVHDSREMREYGLRQSRPASKIAFWMKWFSRDFDEDRYLNEKPFQDYTWIDEGDTFDLGDDAFEVVNMPGHTPGSIALYSKKRKLMLVSDAANPMIFLQLPESEPLSVYQQSLRHALSYDFDTFLTGHVPKLFPRSDMEQYLKVACSLDWEHGKPKKNYPLNPDADVRICHAVGDRSRKSPVVWITGDKVNA